MRDNPHHACESRECLDQERIFRCESLFHGQKKAIKSLD